MKAFLLAFSRIVDLFYIFLCVSLIFCQTPTGLAIVSLLSFVDRGHLEIGFLIRNEKCKVAVYTDSTIFEKDFATPDKLL